jgi:hypothetical protein
MSGQCSDATVKNLTANKKPHDNGVMRQIA